MKLSIFPGVLYCAAAIAAADESVITAPSLAPPVHFSVDAPELWHNVPEHPEVAITAAEDGTVLFGWDGNADFSGANPRFGRVESTESLPVEPGPDRRVRLVLEFAAPLIEADTELAPLVILLDRDGRRLGEMGLFSFDEQLYFNFETAPGQTRRIEKSFHASPELGAIGIGFAFNGNRVRMNLKLATLEPAPAKPGWDPVVRRRTPLLPDVRFHDDGLTPQADTVLLDDAALARLLEEREAAYPLIRQRAERQVFSINGREMPFAIHYTPLVTGLDGAMLQAMERIGFRIHTITVRTGPCADSVLSPSNIWLGRGRYDFSPVAREIRQVLSRVPQAFIMLNIVINVYSEWGEEFPGDVHADPRGEKGVADWSRVTRYGGEKPSGREFWEASNHSRQFREDGAAMLEAFGAWLNRAPEGKAVIGAYLNGGADNQWLFSYEPEFADYSTGARDAFRDYLREKYRNDPAALSRAWGFEADFAAAEVPPFALRRARPENLSPLLTANAAQSQAQDYNAFLSVSNTRRQIAFAEAFKRGSRQRLLTGMYWPTLPASYPLCHGDFKELTASNAIDFISRGGSLGAALHGKLPVAELDLRDVNSGLDAWLDYSHPYIAKSPAEFRRQALGAIAAQYAAGGGFHLWDMNGGWFWHPETQKTLHEGLAFGESLRDVPPVGDDYIGVFVDEDAANHTYLLGAPWNSAAVEKTVKHMGMNGVQLWGHTGVTVRFFLQDDALDPGLTVPKVAIFLNPLTLSPEKAARIEERFGLAGHLLVYLTAPGLAAPGTPDNPNTITGFRLAEHPGTRNRGLTFAAVADPLLDGIRPGLHLNSYTPEMDMANIISAAALPDSPGTVLAHYSGTELPAMLVLRGKAYTKVWIGAPGGLSTQLVRNLAKAGGVHVWAENDSAVYYGAGLLAVIARPKGGLQRIALPENIAIARCLTGQDYTCIDGELTFNLKGANIYGDVAVFAVAGQAYGEEKERCE